MTDDRDQKTEVSWQRTDGWKVRRSEGQKVGVFSALFLLLLKLAIHEKDLTVIVNSII
jgi:hypothetical protein